MTTYVLDSATAPSSPGRSAPDGVASGAAATRRRLDAVDVGDGWRCLVVGGDRSVAEWLQARVGTTGSVFVTDLDSRWGDGLAAAGLPADLCDPVTDRLPSGWFDLVHVRLGGVHPLDRTRTLENLVASVRPGGWILVEDVVALPFELPAGVAGTGAWAVTAALRTVAEHRGADLAWAAKVPGLLRAQGCSDVIREGFCSVGSVGATVNLPDPAPNPDAGAGAPTGSDGAIPLELAPFRWLLVDPYRGRPVDPSRAADASVVFFTTGRR